MRSFVMQPRRVPSHWDAKAGATVFDAEIGGARTLICRRKGRFGAPAAGSA